MVQFWVGCISVMNEKSFFAVWWQTHRANLHGRARNAMFCLSMYETRPPLLQPVCSVRCISLCFFFHSCSIQSRSYAMANSGFQPGFHLGSCFGFQFHHPSVLPITRDLYTDLVLVILIFDFLVVICFSLFRVSPKLLSLSLLDCAVVVWTDWLRFCPFSCVWLCCWCVGSDSHFVLRGFDFCIWLVSELGAQLTFLFHLDFPLSELVLWLHCVMFLDWFTSEVYHQCDVNY